MPAGKTMREEDIRPKALLDEFFRRLKIDADRLAVRRGIVPAALEQFLGDIGLSSHIQ